MKRIVLALAAFAGVALATSSALADHGYSRSYVGRGNYGCVSGAPIGYNVYRDPYLYSYPTYRYRYADSVYFDHHRGYFYDHHQHGGIGVHVPHFSIRLGF